MQKHQFYSDNWSLLSGKCARLVLHDKPGIVCWKTLRGKDRNLASQHAVEGQ